MRIRRGPRSALAGFGLGLGVLATSLLLLLGASPAAAHDALMSSDPAADSTVDEPVESVTLTFSGQVEKTVDGFEVFDPIDGSRSPTQATTADGGTTWTLTFDPPLAGGEVGFRWEVISADGHPKDGSFVFTVNANRPVSTLPPTTLPPPTTVPVDGELSGGVSGSAALIDAEETPAPMANADEELDEFLEDDATVASTLRPLTTIVRLFELLGAVICIGGLVFAAKVLNGERRDVDLVLWMVRRAALLVVAGSLVELVMQAVTGGGWSAAASPTAIDDVVGGSFGLPVILRAAGGAMVAVGARPGSSPTYPGTVAGAAALTVAHLFDGHTVTAGNRLLTGLADLVHVIGGGVWAGGVVMLVTVVARRRAAGETEGLWPLVARFSVVATWALVAVGLAGVALTLSIVDSASQLWSSGWGRVLLAKVVLVAIAAGFGAYHHFSLLPQLDPSGAGSATASDDSADAAARSTAVDKFRSSLRIEAVVLTLVVVATAILVSSST